MTYSLIMASKPVAAYFFEESPAEDYSKRGEGNVSFTSAGTVGLFNLGGCVDGQVPITLPTPVGNVWSITSTVRTVEGLTQDIWKFTGTGTSLFVDTSGVIHFSTAPHGDEIVYPMAHESAFIISIIKNEESVTMFIDGAPVGSILQSEVDSASTVTLGHAESVFYTGIFIVHDSPVEDWFHQGLSRELVRLPTRQRAATQYGSSAFVPDINSRNCNVIIPEVIENEDVIEEPGRYYVEMLDTGSIEGTITLSATLNGYVHAAAVKWDRGHAQFVETSQDGGETWQEANNGVPNVWAEFVEEPESLLIKVTFPGDENIMPFIEGLRVLEYEDDIVNSISFTDREANVEYRAVHSDYSYPLKMHGVGMELVPGGSNAFIVREDVGEEPAAISAVEIVMNVRDASNRTLISPTTGQSLTTTSNKLIFNPAQVTVFVNGDQVTTSNTYQLRRGLSYHIICNYATPVPASEEIHFLGTSGSSELSDDFCTIEIHGQPFDATKAAAKYAIVSEFSTIGAEESSFFTLSDSSPSVLALNWTGAGA